MTVVEYGWIRAGKWRQPAIANAVHSQSESGGVNPIERVDSRNIGDIRVTALDAGRFSLDGGTMFGVVPRAIWEKKIPPDERNRIQLGLNCLLVETGTETVLVETGVGAAKLPPKYRDIYGADPILGCDRSACRSGG